MKKVALTVLFVILVLPAVVFAVDDYGFTYGDWEIDGNRLYQNDVDTSIAKAWLAYEQEGMVEYNFNVRYEEGLFDDGHAGFGIHVFVDKPARGFSWGEGKSWLFWVNYDDNPKSKAIPEGLSVQVYKSTANYKMELVDSISLAAVEKALFTYPAGTKVPVRMMINGRTGVVKVYDPVKSSIYYTYKLDTSMPLKGDFVTLRTNSGSFSFGY